MISGQFQNQVQTPRILLRKQGAPLWGFSASRNVVVNYTVVRLIAAMDDGEKSPYVKMDLDALVRSGF